MSTPAAVSDRMRAWVTAQYDALIPTRSRVIIDEAMEELGGSDPEQRRIFVAFVAGIIYELHRSLDPDDPWRSLEDQGEGKVPRTRLGQDFGTFHSALDVLVPASRVVDFDPNLAALAQPLSPDAARLLAVASSDLDHLRMEVAQVRPSEALDAVRWLVHRRRTFTGLDDPWVLTMMETWASRAARVADGQQWDQERADRTREASAVPAGTWASFAGL